MDEPCHCGRTRRRTLEILVSALLSSLPAGSPSAADPNAGLREKLAREGSVAVLVRLDVGDTRVWSRAPAAVRRARVSRARAGALEVDADGLARLEASRGVLSIVEDRPHAPTLDRSTVLIQALATWADGV